MFQLAKNFQDKANELVASYLKEIESLLKQQSKNKFWKKNDKKLKDLFVFFSIDVSDKTRSAVETYEKSRLAGIPALFDKKETTKVCVLFVWK